MKKENVEGNGGKVPCVVHGFQLKFSYISLIALWD